MGWDFSWNILSLLIATRLLSSPQAASTLYCTHTCAMGSGCTTEVATVFLLTKRMRLLNDIFHKYNPLGSHYKMNIAHLEDSNNHAFSLQ